MDKERHTAGRKRAGFACLGPRQNLLLAALPDSVLERLLPNLQGVPLSAGDVLCDTNEPVTLAWFPTTAILSLQQVLSGDDSSEIALTGRDGMAGLPIVTGARSSSTRVVVHCPGTAYRLRAECVLEELARAGSFRRLMLRYTQVKMAQIAQSAVCYRHHTVEQQVARRLLMHLDRMTSSDIPVTHELMAAALGVRREAVTLATARLQIQGLLAPSRGRVVVLDRKGLEGCACECYGVLRHETARLIPTEPGSSRAA